MVPGADVQQSLRALPSVDRLLGEPSLAETLGAYARPQVVWAARVILEQARASILKGADEMPSPSGLAQQVAVYLNQVGLGLRRVINATGVVLHTNLGRAPLSAAALAAMQTIGAGYSSLEYDLEIGERGSRHEHASRLLRQVTGAEAGVVVNNNASAVLLVLSCLANGHEVIVSRGQLVEIGGGFRIPDVLRQSGGRLVEVGTTNRTYVEDFRAAITEQTAVLLRVHASNYRMTGFVHSPTLGELAELAAAHKLPLVDDLGSGSLLDTNRYGLAAEPTVQESVSSGASLVCFSGDKLIGGPQAGVIVGRADLIGRLKRHPLMRAIRPDKMTLAGLMATLVHYSRDEAEREIPVWRMLAASTDELGARAAAVGQRLPREVAWDVWEGRSAVGGGSLPGETLPTRLLAVGANGGANRLAQALRFQEPPVVARIERDRVVLDLRTVLPDEDELLAQALVAALGEQR